MTSFRWDICNLWKLPREIDKSNLKLLVLDEPTAVLTESEAERFLKCIRQVADEGIAVIFISHRLDEVMTLADSVVILRDGQMVFDEKTKNTSKNQIAELMVGRKLEADSMINVNRSFENSDIILDIEHLSVSMPGERTKDVSLKVRQRGDTGHRRPGGPRQDQYFQRYFRHVSGQGAGCAITGRSWPLPGWARH